MARRRIPQRSRKAASTYTPSIPAPVGGLNARDPLDAMPATDAIRIENQFCETASVRTRDGHSAYSTGMPSGPVETLAVWRGAASEKLVSGVAGELYDSTAAGAATVISSMADYVSNQWQTFNFKNRLFGVNGVDSAWDYDGTTLNTTSWTGVSSSSLVQAAVFNTRIYLVEKNSASFWYAGSGAVTGALTEFDLSTIVQRGGAIQAVGSWSRDGGAGLDDLFVAVMASGEIVVYQGSDPGSNFVKVGSYYAAPPIGRRCLTEIGGDLVVITRAGYLPISLIMQGWEVERIHLNTSWGKISPVVRDAANVSTAFGWEAGELTENGRVYFNHPSGAAGAFNQHVLNTFTGAWSTFNGLNASSWRIFGGALYFGGQDGVVYSHAGNTDGGSAVPFRVKQAFNYFGQRQIRKQASMMLPVLKVNGSLTAAFGLDADFSDSTLVADTVTLSGNPSGSAWDEALWDEAEWAHSAEATTTWIGANAEGWALAPRFEGETVIPVEWFSSRVMMKGGGQL